MTIRTLTGKLIEAHITLSKPSFKGRAHRGEMEIRRGTTIIITIRRNTTIGIFIESRGGTGRIPGK